MTSKVRMIKRFLPAAMAFGATCLIALSVQAVTTLTIDSLATGETDVIELPDDAKLNIEVTETGIKLVVPNVPIKVKCLALASAPNTCTLLAGSGGSGVDSDSDGVIDSTPDTCPNTPEGSFVDSSGCSSDQRDDDNDGIPNGSDSCENTPSNETANSSGCSPSQIDGDADGDGVNDSADNCKNEAGPADNNGCPLPDDDDFTNLYCANAPGNVVCSKNKNLDSIYGTTAFEDYFISSGKIIALPFTIRDVSAESAAYGRWSFVTPENTIGGVGEPYFRMWISSTPGGTPLAGQLCNEYFLVADGAFGWAQYNTEYSCVVGEETDSGVRYLNMAVSCNVAETGCDADNEFPNHSGYELTMGGSYQ